ncbi:hypothetical protein MMC08_004089 [Hypocenomyce scalaris]|nr:hypothetical protein [Hypocenomyce scalaris]
MSFQSSPASPLCSPIFNSNLRRFTPSTCPLHPIHNADLQDEALTLTPPPLFAGQDRVLSTQLPAAPGENLLLKNFLLTLDLINEIDDFLDQLLQDGTAIRMREVEIAAVESNYQASQEPTTPPLEWNRLSMDLWNLLQEDISLAGQIGSAEWANSDGFSSADSDRSALHRPSIFTDIDVQNQLMNFQIRIRRRPCKLSEPISPKTVGGHF